MIAETGEVPAFPEAQPLTLQLALIPIPSLLIFRTKDAKLTGVLRLDIGVPPFTKSLAASFTQIVLDSFAILVVMFAVFDCLLALAVGGIPSLSPSLCLYFLLPLIY
jgi:hypothetical protein